MQIAKDVYNWLYNRSFCEKLALGVTGVYAMIELGLIPEKYVYKYMLLKSTGIEKNNLLNFLISPFVVTELGHFIKNMLHFKIIDGLLKNNNLGLTERFDHKLFIFYTGHYVGLICLKIAQKHPEFSLVGPKFGLYSLMGYYSTQIFLREEVLTSSYFSMGFFFIFEILLKDVSFDKESYVSLRNYDSLFEILYPIITSSASGIAINLIC